MPVGIKDAWYHESGNSITTFATSFVKTPRVGAVILSCITWDKTPGTVTVPTGWTSVRQHINASVSGQMAMRVADGTAADNPTWNWTTASPNGASVTNLETDSGALTVVTAVTAFDDLNAKTLSADAGTATTDGLAVVFSGVDSNFELRSHSKGSFPTGDYAHHSSRIHASVLGHPSQTVGSKRLVNTTTTALTFEIPADESADQRFVILVKFSGTALSPQVSRSWLGEVTETTAKLAVVATASATSVIGVASLTADLAAPISTTSVALDAAGRGMVTFTGLTKNTKYFYGVQLNGGTALPIGEFKTSPSHGSYVFAVASCRNDAVLKDGAAFANIAASGADLFLQIGDFHYQDLSVLNVNMAHMGLDMAVQQPGVGSVLKKMSTHYVWDDHDYAGNNSAGNFGGGAESRAAYKNRIPVSQVAADGIYHTFVRGRVRFIMLDSRSMRVVNSATDDATKTMLGATQKQWLKDTITAATEPVIVIATPSPWVEAVTAGSDAWGGFSTERTELVNFFTASGKKDRLYFVSGDAHMLAYDNGTNSPGAIPIAHCGPLGQDVSIKGGPYSAGTFTTTNSQFGKFTVTDTGGTSITLQFEGKDSANESVVTATNTFAATAVPAEVVPGPVITNDPKLSVQDNRRANLLADAGLTTSPLSNTDLYRLYLLKQQGLTATTGSKTSMSDLGGKNYFKPLG